jgi:hypothetical protein
VAAAVEFVGSSVPRASKSIQPSRFNTFAYSSRYGLLSLIAVGAVWNRCSRKRAVHVFWSVISRAFTT